MTTPSTRDKIDALRRLMRSHKLHAYLVPSTDPHLSEYVPACWERRSWVSGFTGSAGDVLVTRAGAGLWTDGRYFFQAEEQLDGSGIELFRTGEPGVPSLESHLETVLTRGQRLGVDPRVLSLSRAASLEKALARVGAKLALVDQNLVDAVWVDRPAMPSSPLEVLPTSRTGEKTASKLARIRQKMQERNADAHVLTTLDAVAWVFNIRGRDVAYNPMAIGYALITQQQATVFLEPGKVAAPAARKLGAHVQLLPYDAITAALGRLSQDKNRVWLDGNGTNRWVAQQLKGCELLTEEGPVAAMKARKNAIEIKGMRAAHLRDGVAMVRLLSWLSEHVKGGEVTELSAEAQLERFRSEGQGYRGPSFRTIAGYGGHGAVIHYTADDATNATLQPKGIFLLDSGGQYIDGTTDITRTLLLGCKASATQRRIFTLVLKGHIALARAKFPSGVRGMRLDTLARMHLWAAGLDYSHGTGHGVGTYLNVHEGPQSISPLRCTGATLEPGNILSNEPGYYEKNQFGIRTENLMLVVQDDELSREGATWLRFEVITLCPIDRALVDRSLLTAEELAWLNDYHARVKRTLSPLLRDAAEKRWLAAACQPI